MDSSTPTCGLEIRGNSHYTALHVQTRSIQPRRRIRLLDLGVGQPAFVANQDHFAGKPFCAICKKPIYQHWVTICVLRAHLRIGGGADLGGLHGVLLDQNRRFGAILGLKMGLRKPPRSLGLSPKFCMRPRFTAGSSAGKWTWAVAPKVVPGCSSRRTRAPTHKGMVRSYRP
jgi:hypothetical protein